MTDFDAFAPPRDQQFLAMGDLCSLLQVLPAQLRTLMEQANVKFSLVLSGVGFLRVADAERVCEACIAVRREISDAVGKVEASPLN